VTATDFDARFLSGKELYGDDFDPREIEAWYEDEREGYADLGAGAVDSPGATSYAYSALNTHHCFRHLPQGPIGDVLGVGAAYGQELAPVADRVSSVTILEPSTQLRAASVGGHAIRYVEPSASGDMPFDDASFDLVTSFGVLHHIPNVTKVVDEVHRVLRAGGHFVLREPIHSMGDWRVPRSGLTARERGIPVRLLRGITGNRFTVVHDAYCDFPLWSRFGDISRRTDVLLDQALARAFVWNYRYHARSGWQKVRPRGLALVLRK